jgi:AraC-like DNA-binding protein
MDDGIHLEIAKEAVHQHVDEDVEVTSPVVVEALEQIRQHLFEEEFDEGKLLELLDGDEEDLMLSFARDLGESPGSYMTKLRVIGALQLIAKTHLPMDRITELLGWATSKALSSDCRMVYGLTAGELRRRAHRALPHLVPETEQRMANPEIQPLTAEERLRFAHHLARELGQWLTPERLDLLTDGTLKVDPVVFELMKSDAN